MAERVVHEVPERLAQSDAVAEQVVVPFDVYDDVPVMRCGAVDEPVSHAVEHRPHRKRFEEQGQPVLVGSRDDQQVFGELAEAVALLDGGLEGIADVRPEVPGTQRTFELGLGDGDRCTQLVAGIRHEASLALE
ncbi:MAG: hypothetical protein WKF64_03250 [Ilumatobacteraceae bacterium]